MPYDQSSFEFDLALIPSGYSEGEFNGRRWGVTVRRDAEEKRIWLFAEDLSGKDIVSFNLYRMKSGVLALKPCEMSSDKVVDFVHGYRLRKDKQAEG
ncbi:hypothetical protein E2F50_02945 [Rhizobium deserti]|uniref:Uncharacterized protein n=1 Tax=Rhizobium deserti TaxID=2547961 RepID=A0A4R5UMI7_9HYPH|nr:hypothetical protein [Rhizobium deserti]TDK39107.1 hypothetical protein E2F50_02945 [Rhizobium deserti]